MLFNYPLTQPSDSGGTAAVKDEMVNVGVHPEAVFSWRKEQFERLGFAEHAADHLAFTRVDLHQMELLLTRGATHDQALRILADTWTLGEDPTDYSKISREGLTEALTAS